MTAVVGKGAGGQHVSRDLPASSAMFAMSHHSTVPHEPNSNVFSNGVGAAASLSDFSSIRHFRSSGPVPSSSNTLHDVLQGNLHETSFVQSNRNRKRRERHQARMQRKQETNRHMKRRMIWNRMQREERIARDQAADQKQLPHIQVPAQPGYVRIGNINIEKSNPEKLEQLVCLAAHRGWEVTIVSECCPTARGARQNPQVNCWHWKWEGWELIHTGSVGILLNPDWSHAWHTHSTPKYRSPTGRVLSLVLPRDPLSDTGQRSPSWLVTAVWAPVSTSTVEELDTFWDEIACATRRECQFRPESRLTATLHEHTLSKRRRSSRRSSI